MNKNSFKKGFTIAELVVVVVVIGILVAITAFGVRSAQADSRDKQRNVTVTLLAEALEKYYDSHGEYPSCSQMTGSAKSVQQVIDIDVAALKAPRASTDNSVTCSDITSSTTSDVFAYVGDGTTKCSGDVACLYWVIKYKSEAGGDIKSLQSRRRANIALAPDAPTSTIATTVSGSTASGAASQVSCPAGSLEYRIDLQVNDGSWQTGTWGASRLRSATADQGSKYAYRAATRCVLSDGTEGKITLGNIASQVRGISAPSAPTITASATGTGTANTVTWSWSGSSCPVGTNLLYSSAYFREDPTSWRAWSADSSTTSYAVSTAYEGYEYNVRARALCKTAYATSPSAERTGTSFIRAVSTPGKATAFNVYRQSNPETSGRTEIAYGYWTAPECGTGTARRLQVKTARVSNSANSAVYPDYSAAFSFIFSTDASTPYSNYKPDPSYEMDQNISRQLYRYQTAWEQYLLGPYLYASQAPSPIDPANQGQEWQTWVVTSADPVVLGRTPTLYDNGSPVNTWYRGARVYVRYACVNTTTNRFSVGEPSTSGWYAW